MADRLEDLPPHFRGLVVAAAKRQGVDLGPVPAPGAAAGTRSRPSPTPRPSDGRVQHAPARAAKRAPHVAGEANATEALFESDHLVPRQAAGEFVWYAFELVTLKLGRDLRYTPDWWAVRPGGASVAFEVKGGREEDDARVKRILAAETCPWLELWLAKRLPKAEGGGWKLSRVEPLEHVRARPLQVKATPRPVAVDP